MIAVDLLLLAATIAVVLVALPRIIFPLERFSGTTFDRVMAGAVLMTALSLAAMFLLATFNILETFALVAVWAVTWYLLKGRSRGLAASLTGFAHNVFVIFDLAEVKGGRTAAREWRDGVADENRRRATSWAAAARDHLPGPAAVLSSAAILLALSVAAWLRFDRAVHHVELVPQDSYLALVATKFVNDGGVLGESIYPHGAYMWMSLLDRFYPLDTFGFVRFAGPAMNVLELVCMYWAVSRVARSRVAGLLAIGVWGLFAGHPDTLVIWNRQIGSMTQEFALAFAIVSLAFGARYASEHRGEDLMLSGAALFVALASHTMVMPFLAMGFLAIIAMGFATSSWSGAALRRLVIVGIAAFAAGNYYFVLGFMRGLPLAQVFNLYSPGNQFGFSATRVDLAPRHELAVNHLYQLGVLGAVAAIAVGAFFAYYRTDSRLRGRTLGGMGVAVLAMLLFFDTFAIRFGFLFRSRQAAIAGAMMPVGIALGLGALLLTASVVLESGDLLWQRERQAGALPRRTALELAGLAACGLLIAVLWPSYSAFAREAGPSGYPEATSVSLRILEGEDPLRFTFVGLSEQYQESFNIGFFVEAWVFARDITLSEARDPSYEVPIPTDRVYIFVEKDIFPTASSPPFGPTEEYYRNAVKRTRIMRRIFLWSETYRDYHTDMSVVYDDPKIRVYEIRRNVDVSRADTYPAFKDYRWKLGQYFDDDGDITADREVPNPAGEDALLEAARGRPVASPEATASPGP